MGASAARAAGLSRPKVQKALADLAGVPQAMASRRARRPGGGRRRAVDQDPGLVDALKALVDPVTESLAA